MKNNSGFTVFEIVIVIAILSILAAISIPNFMLLKERLDLDNNTQEFVSALKSAQNKTLSSENYDQYGVYVNTGVSPNQYTLFKGSSYASRTVSADKVYSLQSTMEFYDISLGGGNEIVFDRLTGATEQFGTISLRVKTDTNQNKTIYIANSGAIGFTTPVVPTDEGRIDDSRHIQFSYSRNINATNENIVLLFDGSVTETIPISSHLVAGELQWQGTISVGGSNQVVEINTHRLNNPDTLFSIHRDRRYNNKSLKITISGDASGSLAEYTADGTIVSHPSGYISDFEWQ